MKLFEIKRFFKQEDKKTNNLEEELYILKTGIKIPKGRYECMGANMIPFRKLHSERELKQEIRSHVTSKKANAYERAKSIITEVPGTIFGIQNYLIIYYQIDSDLLPKRSSKRKKTLYGQKELDLFGKPGISQPIILHPNKEGKGVQKEKKIS